MEPLRLGHPPGAREEVLAHLMQSLVGHGGETPQEGIAPEVVPGGLHLDDRCTGGALGGQSSQDGPAIARVLAGFRREGRARQLTRCVKLDVSKSTQSPLK